MNFERVFFTPPATGHLTVFVTFLAFLYICLFYYFYFPFPFTLPLSSSFVHISPFLTCRFSYFPKYGTSGLNPPGGGVLSNILTPAKT